MKKTWFAVVLVSIVILLAIPAGAVQAGNLQHDMEDYCGFFGASLILVENNVYGWRCIDSVGNEYNLDLNAICLSRFGDHFDARFLDWNRSDSWGCFPEEANFSPKY